MTSAETDLDELVKVFVDGAATYWRDHGRPDFVPSPPTAATRCGIRAVVAHLEQTAPAAVGRCGVVSPLMLEDQDGFSTCCLPAGHAGWHRGDTGSEWGVARDISGEVKRAVAEQVLTERADELERMAERMGAENALVGAAARVVVDHLRGYVKYRLPFEFSGGE